MRSKCLLIFLLFACREEFFPRDLYDYQIERLLSGGSAKTWLQMINSVECSDSVRLHITLLSSSSDDSISIFNLLPKSNCFGYDTAFVGNANASGNLLFTDSLLFADGDFWIVESVTSENLSIRDLEIKHFISN